MVRVNVARSRKEEKKNGGLRQCQELRSASTIKKRPESEAKGIVVIKVPAAGRKFSIRTSTKGPVGLKDG
jgi:hypothetical protein